MVGLVLVTDSLFVLKEHEEQLRSAGYEVRRLDKPNASEAELIEGLKDADGYILGGIERLTSVVLDQAPKLRAIAFTGSGYQEFIPSHEVATKRGIPIAAAIGGNRLAVAEYTLTLILMMLRDTPNLMPPGTVSFATTSSAEDTTVGVLGFGAIGSKVAEFCVALGFKVLATPRDLHKVHPAVAGVNLVPKQELLQQSDIVTLHVSPKHGHHALSGDDISKLKNGTIVVNAAFIGAVDDDAIVQRLLKGELRAAYDAPMKVSTAGIPRNGLIQSNMQTAFNTSPTNKRIGDWVTRAMIAMLSGKDDPLIVNRSQLPGIR